MVQDEDTSNCDNADWEVLLDLNELSEKDDDLNSKKITYNEHQQMRSAQSVFFTCKISIT